LKSKQNKNENFYEVHGIGLTSDYSFAELRSLRVDALARDKTIVHIVRARSQEALALCGKRVRSVALQRDVRIDRFPHGVLMRSYCGSVGFFDRATNTIHLARGPSISATRFEHTLMHAMLPRVMSELGMLVLHAACIEIDGTYTMIAGQGGMGKSTLAAGFGLDGSRVIAEDILRVEIGDNGLLAWPSYPGARLRAKSFLLSSRGHTKASRYGLPKHRIALGTNHGEHAPVPLSVALFLKRGRAVHGRFTRLSPVDALRRLLEATFLLPGAERQFGRDWFLRMTSGAMKLRAAELAYKQSAPHFDAFKQEIRAFSRNAPLNKDKKRNGA
jgi:hypothetical protein